jgi:triosephosphate isomerase
MGNKYCIANWKMNFTTQSGVNFVNALTTKSLSNNGTHIILCPSYTSLGSVSQACNGSEIQVGAQNVYYEDKGAFTGEISTEMIAESGCDWVILGHSERRHVLGETDLVISKKFDQALENGLKPILCIGETLAERESGETDSVLKRQLSAVLADIKSTNYIVAYEPVWAIGTGKSATSEMVAETHLAVRNIISELGLNGELIPVLYGGSVSDANAAELSEVPNVDGFLIGGASLDVEKFYNIYLEL